MQSAFAFTMMMLAAVQAQPQTITPECFSTIHPGGSMVNILPDLELHWKTDGDKITLTLVYQREGWIGIGFSEEEGGMIGSPAILGLPGVHTFPTLYQLDAKLSSGVVESLNQAIVSTDPNFPVTQMEGVTQMQFTLPLSREMLLQEDGLSTVIYAVGDNNELGFHRESGSFRIDWTHCEFAVEPITSRCPSAIHPEGSMANLLPGLELHWKVVDGELTITLIYQDEAWIGIGLSEEGGMINSVAILGLPGVHTVPTLYELAGKVSYEVRQFPSQSLLRTDPVTQAEGVTQMQFSMPLFNEILLQEDGLSTMIYAVGASNELGYHRHRGSFRIDWDGCTNVVEVSPTLAPTITKVPSEPEEGDLISSQKKAFATPAFFVTLALAIAIPLSI